MVTHMSVGLFEYVEVSVFRLRCFVCVLQFWHRNPFEPVSKDVCALRLTLNVDSVANVSVVTYTATVCVIINY